MHQTNEIRPPVQATESPGLRAVSAFRKPPHHLNCAQAVAHAWASDPASAHAAIADHAAHGGGHAPAGECGALFAACQVATRHTRDTAAVRQRFAALHGHTTCRELRARRVPCAECVHTAAELVNDAR